MKTIGIKDIAKKAGVSTGTVDRVLHNRGEVKAETQAKIMAIVKELGYKPNIFARSLASKTQKRIAIITPDLSDRNPYWEKSSLGFDKAKNELNKHNIKLEEVHYDASNEESYRAALSTVCQNLPDGIILDPVFEESSLEFSPIFDNKKLPYVFIDVNIDGLNNLAYFGQNAKQSGRVSGKLMAQSITKNETILIVKLSKNKVFSQHIHERIAGFTEYFSNNENNIHTIELSYQDLEKEKNALDDLLCTTNYQHIFVPNSRAYLVVDRLKHHNYKTLIGYDLVSQNIKHLHQDKITYLISQKPEEQAYKATYALFNYLVSREEVTKINYSPIDILIKENINFYTKKQLK